MPRWLRAFSAQRSSATLSPEKRLPPCLSFRLSFSVLNRIAESRLNYFFFTLVLVFFVPVLSFFFLAPAALPEAFNFLGPL